MSNDLLLKSNINKQTFGQLVQKHRKKKGYSQDKLAELLGITRKSISCIERGECYPSQDNIFRVSQILDFSLDEYVFGYGKFDETISINEVNELLQMMNSDQRKTVIYVVRALCKALLTDKNNEV